MTPQQANTLERQLQQNHVDIQRLWKRLSLMPQAYVGMPMAAAAGGLTTDTMPPTTTTGTVTTGTTTLTTRPPTYCQVIGTGTFRIDIPGISEIECPGMPVGATSPPTGCEGLNPGPYTIPSGPQLVGYDICGGASILYPHNNRYYMYGFVTSSISGGTCYIGVRVFAVTDSTPSASQMGKCYLSAGFTQSFQPWPVGEVRLLFPYTALDENCPIGLGNVPCQFPEAILATRTT